MTIAVVSAIEPKLLQTEIEIAGATATGEPHRL